MTQFPGEEVEYLSADMAEGADDQWPTEFLNSLNIGGFPPHKLILKVGTPIILLWNIQPSNGLCDGTRLVCHFFQKHVIEAEIITGSHPGIRVFIPCIMMSP